MIKIDLIDFLEKLIASPLIWLITLTLVICAIYLRNTYSYWDVRNVPGPSPIWLFGNLIPRLRATLSLAEYDQQIYKCYGGAKYCGYYEFMKPVLMIGDPELLKHVMIKDFDHFTDRR